MLASSLSRLLLVALLATTAANAQYSSLTAEGTVASEGDLAASHWLTERGYEGSWTLSGQELVVDRVIGTTGVQAGGASYTAPGNSIRARYYEATATSVINQDWAYMEVHALPQGATVALADSLHRLSSHNETTRTSVGWVDGTQYEISIRDTAKATPPASMEVRGDFFLTLYGWDLHIETTGGRSVDEWSGDGDLAFGHGGLAKAKVAPQQLELYVHNGALRLTGAHAEGALYHRNVMVDVDGTITLNGPSKQTILEGHHALWFLPVPDALRLVATQDMAGLAPPESGSGPSEQPSEAGGDAPNESNPSQADQHEPVAADPQQEPTRPVTQIAMPALTSIAGSLLFLLLLGLAVYALRARRSPEGNPSVVRTGALMLMRPGDGRRRYEHGLSLMRTRHYRRAARAFEGAVARLDGKWHQAAVYEAARAHARARRPLKAAQWLVTAISHDVRNFARAADDPAFERVRGSPDFRAVTAAVMGLDGADQA